MRFYLGTHHASQRWFDLGVPLFISRRTLTDRHSLPIPRVRWALDSGSFSELDNPPHRFVTTVDEYVYDCLRFQAEMPLLDWVAPMDWMCEPFITRKTGLDVAEHQRRTVENFLELRARLGSLVIPVLQGFDRADYFDCWRLYDEAGVDLAAEETVGVGSVCRRQSTAEAQAIFTALAQAGLRLHGFGVKGDGLKSYSASLVSADSMSWSFRARMEALDDEATEPLFPWPILMPCGQLHPIPHKAKSCSNCPEWAVRWREEILAPLEMAA